MAVEELPLDPYMEVPTAKLEIGEVEKNSLFTCPEGRSLLPAVIVPGRRAIGAYGRTVLRAATTGVASWLVR
jgi:hypothetical protein